MALQDYNDFTVSGADAGTITVFSSVYVSTNNRGTQEAYMHRDYGAASFAKNVDIDIEWELLLARNNGVPGHFGLFDAPGTREMLIDNARDAIYLESYADYFRLFLYKSGSNVSDETLNDVIPSGGDNQFYLKMTHTAGADSWVVEVFSDPQRTISLGTMTVNTALDMPNLSVIQPSFTRGNSGGTDKQWGAYNLDILSPGEPVLQPGGKMLLGKPF